MAIETSRDNIQRSSLRLMPRGDDFPTITRQVETVCPFCGVGCGIVLNLDEGDKIVQVDDVPDNLSSAGKLCVKGRFGVGFVHSPDRLTTPMMRSSRDEDFRAVSWDEALDHVAEKFVEHRDKFASVGSAKATNEDGYVLQKFTRAVMGTNSIDHCTRLCHSPSVQAMLQMLGTGATSNSYTDFEEAGCILVAGSDTDTSHPVIAARVRKGVLENGAKLIVINPKRIGLCDIADYHLRLRSGTDVALFNGLAAAVLEEGLENREFIDNRTEGYEEWRAVIDRFSVAQAADITGVPEADIRAAARYYASPPKSHSTILWGMGLTQHIMGTANVQSLLNFILLTGQVGPRGSGISPLRGQNNVQGCGDAGVIPDMLPGYQDILEDQAKFADTWQATLPTETGYKLPEMVMAAEHGDLEAMWIQGENPLLAEPNLTHAREALEQLDFMVFQGPFMNETAEIAHVVLPVGTFAEKDGTFTNSERRVQLVRKAIDAPGEARADWEVTTDIARRVARMLGLDESQFTYSHPSEIFDEMASLVPFLGGISHQRLESGGIQWPCPTPDHPGSSQLFDDEFPRGLGLFVPVEQEEVGAELPDEEYPLLLNTGRVLYHWHGGDISRRTRGLLAMYPDLEVSIHPADAEKFSVVHRARVLVRSRRSELIAVANVTRDVQEGDVFMPFVQLNESAANFLTNDVYDPQSTIPEYKACAVQIASL